MISGMKMDPPIRSGKAGISKVCNVLIRSSDILTGHSLFPTAYETVLECIKILSRTQARSSYLASTTGLRTLQFHTQTPPAGSEATHATKSQQHAVSAICNVLLLHATAPEICTKEGLGDWAARQLASQTAQQVDETWLFLMARVIMVLTSQATYGFLERLVDGLSGLDVVQAVCSVQELENEYSLSRCVLAIARRYPASRSLIPCCRGISEDSISHLCTISRYAKPRMG